MIDGILDIIRRTVYRGRVQKAAQRSNINQKLNELYWVALSHSIESPYPVTVAGCRAEFGTPSYPAYRMATDAESEEAPILTDILENIEGDEIFYDIGANIGTYTCLIGAALDDGCVIAFEPYPPNTDELRENIARNNIDARVFGKALGREEGELNLSVINTDLPGSQQHSITSDYINGRQVRQVSVPVITGDTVVEAEGLPQPDIVKIDVEGAGPDVLRGATIVKDARRVYIEPHQNSRKIKEILRGYGFEIGSLGGCSAERDYIIAKYR